MLTLSVDSIFKTVSEQEFGFKFGEPDRPSDNSLVCILPILRVTSQERQYITMPETEEVLIHDSGSINKVNLKNTSKKNVFVRSGTIFEGKGTQTRALTRSAILYPGMEVGLNVRCIHATHGIHPGAEFKYGGITPLDLDSRTYTSGYASSDQRTMWDAVETYTGSVSMPLGSTTGVYQKSRLPDLPGRMRTRMMNATPTRSLSGHTRPVAMGSNRGIRFGDEPYIPPVEDSIPPSGSAFQSDNLKQNFDAFAKSFDAVLSKARLHENQAGLALITEQGCKTVELFDLPLSWEAIHKDSVKRMGTELLRGKDEASVFQYKPDNAIAAVQKVLGLPFKSNLIYNHKSSNGEPHVSIFGVTADRFVGEVVELDGRVMHAVVLEMC